MDLLSQRYANPYFFIDGMLKSGRFEEFVIKFVETINEDNRNKTLWDIYIHKIEGMSYSEFIEKVETEEQIQEMTADDIETTVNDSLNILQNFKPD